ncbi:MAG: PPC domain-containing DNA-binding protein [Candidatus Neomarinimicrobiota bacterium]
MQYKQNKNCYFVYLEKGEPVVDVLTNFCKEHKILNGHISGIGAVNNIELGAYDSSTKEYIKKTFKETYELINYQGNIMLLEDSPFIHAHVTIGNHNMEVFGGHLFNMNIAVVGEFIIQNIDCNSKRTFNAEIGLATWDLTNKE